MEDNELTKKLSNLSMDSAYGSLPRDSHFQFSAGEILVHSLQLPIVYTNQEFLNELVKRYSQKRAIDMQGILDTLAPRGELISPEILDIQVLSELKGLTYCFLDSHIDVILYRFVLEFTIESLQDFIKQGWRYLQGTMVQRDGEKAIHWFRKAVANVVDPASIEAAQALSLLGLCFLTGCGVPQDCQQALDYFVESTRYTDNESKLSLIQFVSERMIPSGYKKLVAWLSPLVFQGYPPAQHVMGTWHANGKYSLPQNHELACRLFSFSSKQGYPEGMYDYAKCLELGIGCPKNTRQALNWYNAAAIHGHSMAAEKIRNVSAIAEPVDILPFTNSQSKLSVQWLILNL